MEIIVEISYSRPPQNPGSANEECLTQRACKLELDLQKVLSKLDTKDMDIDLLNEEMKTACTTFDILKQRISDLELKAQDEPNDVECSSRPGDWSNNINP